MTTAVAARARHCRMVERSTASAFAWMEGSMGVKRACPTRSGGVLRTSIPRTKGARAGAPGRVAAGGRLAGPAGELAVVLGLEPAKALVVGAGEADHRCGDRPL